MYTCILMNLFLNSHPLVVQDNEGGEVEDHFGMVVCQCLRKEEMSEGEREGGREGGRQGGRGRGKEGWMESKEGRSSQNYGHITVKDPHPCKDCSLQSPPSRWARS